MILVQDKNLTIETRLKTLMMPQENATSSPTNPPHCPSLALLLGESATISHQSTRQLELFRNSTVLFPEPEWVQARARHEDDSQDF